MGTVLLFSVVQIFSEACFKVALHCTYSGAQFIFLLVFTLSSVS